MHEEHSATDKNYRFGKASLFIILLMAASFPSFPWIADQWHDQQRVTQIAIFGTCLLLGFLLSSNAAYRRPLIAPSYSWIIAIILAGGILSAILARHIQWALAEVGMLVSSIALGGLVAKLRRDCGQPLDQWIVGTVFLMITFLLIFYFIIYQSLISGELKSITTYRLLWGFSNPRFFGQFVALTLPLVVYPLLREGCSRGEIVVVSILAVLWWMVAITSATRGLVLGVAAAAFCLGLSGSVGRRWCVVQLGAAALGLLVYWLLITAIPWMLDVQITAFASERLNLSLSGREVIWGQALDMISARPWLGYGPMHFADILNDVATHPHQSILQWASEWGVPSAMAVMALVFLAARKSFGLLRATAESRSAEDTLRVCLVASITTSLALSMVDGVLVMPASQVWLTILGGWLFGMSQVNPTSNESHPLLEGSWSVARVLAVALLVGIIVRDLPNLPRNYVEDPKALRMPRFWSDGLIASSTISPLLQQNNPQAKDVR